MHKALSALLAFVCWTKNNALQWLIVLLKSMSRPRHSSEPSSPGFLSTLARHVMPILRQRSPEPFCWYSNCCTFCEVDHGPQVAPGLFQCSKGAKGCPGTYYVSEKAAWAAHQNATNEFIAKKEKRQAEKVALAKQLKEEAESWEELTRYHEKLARDEAEMAKRKLRREVRRIRIAGRTSAASESSSLNSGITPPCTPDEEAARLEPLSLDHASIPLIVVIPPAGRRGRRAAAQIRKRHDEQYAVGRWPPPPATRKPAAPIPRPTPTPERKPDPIPTVAPSLFSPIAQPRPRYASSSAADSVSLPPVRQRSISRAHLYRQVPATPPPIRALPPKPVLRS